MELSTLLLSRIQFAFTISFHILFPTLTIGLAVYLAFLEGAWLRTRREQYKRLCLFWGKIFALTFGMGVVSGIVLSYEFGTNFSRFSEATGNVLGPLLTYEVMTAFFMEAGFLGVMLLGWNRVGPKFHYFATLMVAAGTVVSAFWILAASSWMHTPAGAELRDGVFHVQSWTAVIFNPSFPYRLAHMLLASLLTTAFFVAGICAWYLLRGTERGFARRALGLALLTAAVLTPLQVLGGDLHGSNAYEHQPMKVAAMEGRWETMAGAPLLLFAWPDPAAESNRLEVGIPKGASWFLEHDADGVVRGLKEVPPEDRPPVAPVFFGFRLMVAVGVLMLAAAWAGVWMDRRGTLERRRWFLKPLVVMAPSGFVATLAGWYVVEIGRQPWLVQGLMRTAEGVSPVAAGQVLTTLVAFIIVYSVLFFAYLYYLLRIIRNGPGLSEPAGPMDRGDHAHPAFVESIGEER
jgi:cytochrome d ubiquinol oxidase subunit I